MTFAESIINFIDKINDKTLARSLNSLLVQYGSKELSAHSEEVYAELLKILPAIVAKWQVSADVNKKDADLARIKKEFLAVVAVPGLLAVIAEKNIELQASIVTSINSVKPSFLTYNFSMQYDFFPDFFDLFLTQENQADVTADIEFIQQFNFIKHIHFLPISKAENILRIIFSAKGAAKGDTFIAALFDINGKLQSPTLTHVLTREISTYDMRLVDAVEMLLTQPGFDLAMILANSDTTEAFKALSFVTERAQSPDVKTKTDLAWLMSSDRTVADLDSISARVKSLGVHDADIFIHELKKYAACFKRLSETLDPKSVDHKRAKRLVELLDTLSLEKQLELETVLGKEIFFDLSVAVIQSSISSYKNKNERVYKTAERMFSAGGRAQTDIKLEFLQALLLDLQAKHDGKLLATIDEKYGVIGLLYRRITGSTPTDVTLNTWLRDVILPGAATKKALSWFPEWYLQICAKNISVLEELFKVDVKREEPAEVLNTSSSAVEAFVSVVEEEAAAQRKRQNRESIRFHLAERAHDEANAQKGADAKAADQPSTTSIFGNFTLVGCNAQQGGDAAKAGGWKLPGLGADSK